MRKRKMCPESLVNRFDKEVRVFKNSDRAKIYDYTDGKK